ncbi:hypothetical protein LJC48_01765 [Desulfovibrio sp. OttesenSCG-928-C06]|nr:hypothetical protein [Desulfovibrio sp. OttesenSCG-928-C06]
MTCRTFFSRCAAFISPAIPSAWVAARPGQPRLVLLPMLVMLYMLIACLQPCGVGAASAAEVITPAAPAAGSYSPQQAGYATNGLPDQTSAQVSEQAYDQAYGQTSEQTSGRTSNQTGGWRQSESERGDDGLYQEGVYLGELLNRAPVLQIAYCAETRGELLPCGT